jgi:heat shock protein HslJ
MNIIVKALGIPGCLALILAAGIAVADQHDDSDEASADELTGSEWWVEDILGGGVVDRSQTTIQFVEPRRVAGNSGCNRYMGGYELSGDRLSFGALAGTMMACPEALMNQEQRFHQAMTQVSQWRIDPDTGLLHLVDESGETVIRASKIEPGTQDDITP